MPKKMFRVTLELKLQRFVDLFNLKKMCVCECVWVLQQIITCRSIRANKGSEHRQLFHSWTLQQQQLLSLPFHHLTRRLPLHLLQHISLFSQVMQNSQRAPEFSRGRDVKDGSMPVWSSAHCEASALIHNCRDDCKHSSKTAVRHSATPSNQQSKHSFLFLLVNSNCHAPPFISSCRFLLKTGDPLKEPTSKASSQVARTLSHKRMSDWIRFYLKCNKRRSINCMLSPIGKS